MIAEGEDGQVVHSQDGGAAGLLDTGTDRKETGYAGNGTTEVHILLDVDSFRGDGNPGGHLLLQKDGQLTDTVTHRVGVAGRREDFKTSENGNTT